MQSTHDNSERLETSPDRGLVFGRGAECDGYWSTRDKRCAKRDRVRERGCVCVCVCEKERKEERQEKRTGPQATVQTVLTQSLCFRQGRAHSWRDAGSVV